MGDKTIKSIKENINDTMKEMGFKSKGQSYIRIINNQIYQAINYQKSVSGNSFTVNIAILPICADDVYLFEPHIRIGDFISGIDVWWDYNEDSVLEVINVINEKILPVLKALTTYEKLYNEIESSLDSELSSKNIVVDYKVGIIKSIRKINLFWLCFKNNKYDKCIEVLEWEKKDIKSWLDRCLEVDNEYKKNTTSEKFIRKIEENDNKLKALAQERTSEVDNLYTLLENKKIEKLTSMVDKIEQTSLKKYKKFVI